MGRARLTTACPRVICPCAATWQCRWSRDQVRCWAGSSLAIPSHEFSLSAPSGLSPPSLPRRPSPLTTFASTRPAKAEIAGAAKSRTRSAEPERNIGGASRGARPSTRRQSHELEETERRFRMLVEGVTDYAIYMLDPAGQIVNWNPGAERIKGYTGDEVLGRHLSDFLHSRGPAG